MKDAALEKHVYELIKEDNKLCGFLSQEPDIGLIPFKRSRERFFLLVNIVVRPDIRDFATISFVARKVVELSSKSDGMEKYPAIETSLFVMHNLKMRRIVRLSVLAESYKFASKLSDADLILKPLFSGVECNWPTSVEKPESITDDFKFNEDYF